MRKWKFDRQCANCGTSPILGSKFCDKRCRQEHTRDRNGRKRTQAEVSASAIINTPHTCAHCGGTFYPKGSDRTKFCSRACSYARQKEDAIKRVILQSRVVVKPEPNIKHKKNPSNLVRHCLTCGDSFIPVDIMQGTKRGRANRYCSKKCDIGSEARKRYRQTDTYRKHMRVTRQRRKLQKKGVTVEYVDPLIVLDRDNWKCRLCGRDTPKILRGTHDMNAPEVDHIVPLAQGGVHSYQNTQCLCRACNAAKGHTCFGLFDT